MASSRSRNYSNSPAVQSAPSSPPQRRPSLTRHTSGRSGLRSAEEQLRDIREGNITWQSPSPNRPVKYSDSSSPNVNPNSNEEHSGEGDRVRVYLHNVRKTDTMPLILLAYEISAPVLKKSNRLWATDSIQTRKRLYLPVDECSIKPQPCPSPSSERTEPTTNQFHDRLTPDGVVHGENGEWPTRLNDQSATSHDEALEAEEWVSIPRVGPTRIISIPAHKLSYFPTQRRNTMERSTSLPTLDSLVLQDRAPRDSMDSIASRSSIGSLVEDGVGRIIRYWHDNQGRKKWAKIGQDLIEL